MTAGHDVPRPPAWSAWWTPGPQGPEEPAVQLDRVPPRPTDPGPSPEAGLPELSGTAITPDGVSSDDRSRGDGGAVASPGRIRARYLALVGLAAFTLLGQGERCLVDSRFSTPSHTLATYWSALRDGDAVTAGECVLDGAEDQPVAGMLWFMPPTREVRLEEFHSLPVEAGRLYVSYQVRFRPLGATEEQTFQTGHELVRLHGGWRIARGLGPASLPQWRSIPRAVDI
jgi:hypothetical protein